MAQPDYVSPEEKAAREKQEKIARSGMGRLFPSLVTADVFKVIPPTFPIGAQGSSSGRDNALRGTLHRV